MIVKTTKLLFLLLVLGTFSVAFTTVYGDEVEDRIEKLQGQIDRLQDRINVLYGDKTNFEDTINSKIETLKLIRETNNDRIESKIQTLVTYIHIKQERIINIGGNITDIAPRNLLITPTPGSVVSDCADTAQGCENLIHPYMLLGGTITFDNTDNVAHTWLSGTPSDDDGGSVFNSGLVLPGQSYQWMPDRVGKQPWFCIIHPWTVNSVTVLLP